MKVALLQMDVAFRQLDKNRQKVREMVAKACREPIDVVVLPELWNTGFFPADVKDLACHEGEPDLEILQELAKKFRVNIIGGSIANIENGQLVNTAYAIGREGQVLSKYNKVHLFSPSGEDNVFTKGNELSVFEIDGVKAGLIICYDVRFLELIRTLALKDIKVLFIPAQWPHPRLEHWKTLVRARAIENQMFVAAVNGVGVSDNKAKFCGHSALVDPWGEYIVVAGEEEGIYVGEMDLAVIEDIRNRINVFRDRRPEIYEIK